MPVKYSHLSDYKIKKIMECFVVDIEACKASELLGLNRNTVNRFYGLFRQLVFERQQDDLVRFFGEVECDEAYFGSERLRGVNMPQKRGRGTWKRPVFGVFERGGRVYTELIPNSKAASLRKVILGKIDVQSVVLTDGWRGFIAVWWTLAMTGISGSTSRNISQTAMGCTSTASKVFGASPKGGLPSSTG